MNDFEHLRTRVIRNDACCRSALDRIEAENERLREALERLLERHEALVAWGAQVLTWETPVLIPGASQPLVIEQLLPQELITGPSGSRELLWGQGDVEPPILVARRALEGSSDE